MIFQCLICRPRLIKEFCDFPKLLVQLIQIDICKYRGTDTTLRRTAVSGVVLPILDIPSFQKLANDVQKTTVLDFLLKISINFS